MRKIMAVIAALCVAALSLAGVGVARAAVDDGIGGTYPPERASVSVLSSVVPAGQGFTVFADGFCASAPVTFTFTAGGSGFTIGPVATDADGHATVAVPASAIPQSGVTYTITGVVGSGPCAGQQGTTLVQVLSASQPPVDTTGDTSDTNPGDTVTDETTAPPIVAQSPAPQPPAAASEAPVAVLSAGVPADPAVAVAANGTGTLPTTGAQPSRMLQIALMSLLTGAGLLIVGAIRRRKHTPAR